MGEVNIKYNWYMKVVIIIASLYIVFVTLICLGKIKESDQVITVGPAHNYEVPTKTHVITEMDGDREINWYSEDESENK